MKSPTVSYLLVPLTLSLAACGTGVEPLASLDEPLDTVEAPLQRRAVEDIREIFCEGAAVDHHLYPGAYVSPLPGRPGQAAIVEVQRERNPPLVRLEQIYELRETVEADGTSLLTFRNPYLHSQWEQTREVRTKDFVTGSLRLRYPGFGLPGFGGGGVEVFEVPCEFLAR